MTEPAFDSAGADALVAQVVSEVDAPFVRAYKSTLGGLRRPSVMVSVSLDPRESWVNGIYENSRYVRLQVSSDGEVALVSSNGLAKRFRKARFKDVAEVVPRINKYLAEVR